MSTGKRTSVDQPLTEHDIADRLDKAALRVLRIMHDVRSNHPELLGPVRGSRYLTNALNALAYELGLDDWNIAPLALRDDGPAADAREDAQHRPCGVCGSRLGGEHGTEAMAHDCPHPGCAFGPRHTVDYHLVDGQRVPVDPQEHVPDLMTALRESLELVTPAQSTAMEVCHHTVEEGCTGHGDF